MTGFSELPRSSRDPMSRFRRPLNANALGDLVETMKSADRQIVDLIRARKSLNKSWASASRSPRISNR